MNKTQAAAMLPLITAMAEGKTIQFLNYLNKWVERDDVEFSGRPENYRIKPEPERLFMVGNQSGTWGKYATREEAEKGLREAAVHFQPQQKYKIYECVEVQE